MITIKRLTAAPSGVVSQARSSHRHGAGAWLAGPRLAGPKLAGLSLAALLAGCGTGPAFPDLRGVPARPVSDYSLEERQAIADELLEARERSLHDGASTRHAVGLAPAPPPLVEPIVPPRLPPEATVVPPPLPGPIRVREGQPDDASLASFLRELTRAQLGEAEDEADLPWR